LWPRDQVSRGVVSAGHIRHLYSFDDSSPFNKDDRFIRGLALDAFGGAIPLVVRYFNRSHTDSMFTMTTALNMGVLRTNMRLPSRVTNRFGRC
jgi:hypothetical protein